MTMLRISVLLSFLSLTKVAGKRQLALFSQPPLLGDPGPRLGLGL